MVLLEDFGAEMKREKDNWRRYLITYLVMRSKQRAALLFFGYYEEFIGKYSLKKKAYIAGYALILEVEFFFLFFYLFFLLFHFGFDLEMPCPCMHPLYLWVIN